MNNEMVQLKFKQTKPLKIGDQIFKSAYDWELTEKDLEKAARELGETEEKKKECLRKLKEKLTDDLNIQYRDDDAYLLRYLRVRKYDVKKAYQNIKHFFEFRKKHPEFFTTPPDALKQVQKLNFYTMLPYADEDDRIIFLLTANRWNMEEQNFEEIVQASFNVTDIVHLNPKCQINGAITIWDFNGISVTHSLQLFKDGRFWKLISVVQNGYPKRIHKVILLNTNRFVRYLYNMVRPIIQKKVADRCVLLGSDMSELHKHVNPLLLPKRLKGNLDEEECDISQIIQDNIHILKYERSFVFK